jgi:hypothetical protein
MTVYDFQERLAFSIAGRTEGVSAIIKQILAGCVSVEKSEVADDRNGIDYWAGLRRGAKVGIDLKTREAGCSRFWRDGPELALEIWSVTPEGSRPGKAGWTLDEAKQTDYTLHLFDPADSPIVYLLPFQLLRTAFRRNLIEWRKWFDEKAQDSGGWRSLALFVPAHIVTASVMDEMTLQPKA